jgi:hypothetical protein
VTPNQKIERYLALTPIKFTVVREVVIRQEALKGETPSLDLTLTLAQRSSVNPSLRLVFRGVRDLQIRQPSLSLFETIDIEITNTSSNQWEDSRYAVKELEEDSLSFICADFEAAIEQ